MACTREVQITAGIWLERCKSHSYEDDYQTPDGASKEQEEPQKV